MNFTGKVQSPCKDCPDREPCCWSNCPKYQAFCAANNSRREAEKKAGNQGAASATGYQGAASATGKSSVALAAGICGKAMGAIGCALCLIERGEWNGETYPIVSAKAVIVDGEHIKENVWYTLKNGEIVEAE